jgi:cytoskeletal protein CcmA (bactofilin family)
MFGKNDNNGSKNGSMNTTELEVCNIASGTTIEGNFKAQSNIRLEGVIEGDVECLGRIVLSEKAQIKGQVQCHTMLCKGKVTGDITATALIHLHNTAVITGDVYYDKLQVDEGAVFNGRATAARSRVNNPMAVKNGKGA